MGKPKFSRNKYESPSHPWEEERIKEENELIKKYGLKNKKEIWKAQTKLRRYRAQARELLASVMGEEAQSKRESDQLLMHLNRINILPANSSLDDVLALEIDSILSRRLQTVTYLKGLASTPVQARQLISHGHIAIDRKRVTVPGYIVTKAEEGKITYTKDSPLNDTMHPARPKAEFKSITSKKETKPEETKKEKDEKQIKPEKTTKDKREEKPEEKSEKDEEKPSEQKTEKEEKKTDEGKTEQNKTNKPSKPETEKQKAEEKKVTDEKTKKDQEKEGGK